MKKQKKKNKEIIKKKFPMVTITREEINRSSLANSEIEKIKYLLTDKTLRGFERYNLEMYLKSLLDDGKKQ